MAFKTGKPGGSEVPLEEESDLGRALRFTVEDESVDLSRVTQTKHRLGERWKTLKEG